MILRYINLWLSPETGYNDKYRYEFTLHTRFICHFFSLRIRKIKFLTDGSFDMVTIAPKPYTEMNAAIRGLNALNVDIPFNKEEYDNIKDISCFDFYLELLSKGFNIASQYKDIPLKTLNDLIVEFRNNGYKNEWLFKKKKFREYNFEVSLNCSFTSYDFSLAISVKKISNNESLIHGIIIRTLPHENYFDKMFKDIIIKDENLIITYADEAPRVIFHIENILNKFFQYELVGNENIKKILSYDGSGFDWASNA